MKFTLIISIFRFIVYCNSAPAAAVMQFACSIKFKNKNHSFMKKGQIQIVFLFMAALTLMTIFKNPSIVVVHPNLDITCYDTFQLLVASLLYHSL